VTSKFWPHFAHPDNVEICLDHILKQMGLDYIDLYLAHWPYAAKPVSREVLLKLTGPDSDEDGMLEEDGKPVVDWEHTSTNIAKQAGECYLCIPWLSCSAKTDVACR
jgi:diketogulonate reductase-like aldo/keto reductase